MLHVPYHCRCHPDRALRRLRMLGLQPRHHRLLPRCAAVCDRGAVIGPVKAAALSVKVACDELGWAFIRDACDATRSVTNFVSMRLPQRLSPSILTLLEWLISCIPPLNELPKARME